MQAQKCLVHYWRCEFDKVYESHEYLKSILALTKLSAAISKFEARMISGTFSMLKSSYGASCISLEPRVIYKKSSHKRCPDKTRNEESTSDLRRQQEHLALEERALRALAEK